MEKFNFIKHFDKKGQSLKKSLMVQKNLTTT